MAIDLEKYTLQNSLEKYKLTTKEKTPQQQADIKSIQEFKPFFPAKTGGSIVGESAKLVGNIPSSLFQFGRGLVNFLNPINTVKTISEVVKSSKEAIKEMGSREFWMGSAILNELPESAYKVLIPKFFRNLIEGNTEEAQRTIVNDPVGQLLPVLMLAKYGATKAGVGKQFDVAISIGAKPITAPVQFIKNKVVSGAGDVITQAFGVTTGAGKLPIKEAFISGKEGITGTPFSEALRGKTAASEVVDTARKAIEVIKGQRAEQYTNELAQISKNKKPIDMSMVEKYLNQQLSQFRIRIDEKGNLDFSKSPIRNKSDAVNDIKTIYEDITNWPDKTPIGLDSLKRGIDTLYSSTSPVRSFVVGTRNSIKNALVKNVPEYSKMVGDYEKVSGFLNEIKSALSIGGKAGTDTVLRKLISTMREDNAFRTDMINQLEQNGNVELTQQIAGHMLSSYAAKGLVGRAAEIGAATMVLTGILTPKALFSLIITSPRLIGEFLQAMGYSYELSSRLINGIKDYYNKYLSKPIETSSIIAPKK